MTISSYMNCVNHKNSIPKLINFQNNLETLPNISSARWNSKATYALIAFFLNSKIFFIIENEKGV